MRGIVTKRINLRERANVNSRILGVYLPDTFVEVVATKEGEEYESDDLWYQLKNGGFLWSGGVRIRLEDSDLPKAEREQFLISYRQSTGDGRILEDRKGVPDKLFFAPITLPVDAENIRVKEWEAKEFVDKVMIDVRKTDPNKKRRHVFIYIPGYQLQLLNSLRTDLLSSFVMSYVTHPENTIAKVLFFSWPSQSGPKRETVDDRSIEAGQNFTAAGMFEYFRLLSKALTDDGRCLNLIVHSFGHQLLNGMVNPLIGTVPDNVFENIFLMAPDISYLSAKHDGAEVDNRFENANGNKKFRYDLSRLRTLAKRVHVFYDKFDFLLYSSTVRFAGGTDLQDPTKTGQFRNLGNYGARDIASGDRENNFDFIDVEEEVKTRAAGDLWDFPHRSLKNKFQSDVNDIWNANNYSGIRGLKIATHSKLFGDRHRYLFTSRPIVDKVLEILK